jgi:putative sigma-54 modulation protein
MIIQTEVIHFVADAQWLSSVERKVSKLGSFFNRINEARVILKQDNLGLKHGRVAEIKLHLPNGIIFIKESSKTFDAALDKALVAMKLQLLRYKTKRLSYCFT